MGQTNFVTPSIERIILIVLDSVGIGELPDAADYGDRGSDTLGHLYERIEGFQLPHLEALGLSRWVQRLSQTANDATWIGASGKMRELSVGKDTMTGHWELAGLRISTALDTFPEGFPDDWLHALEAHTGRGVLGNCVASGTEIVDRLGAEQQQTGKWIVYTSADSVFQIAAHESYVPLEELYEACRFMREYTLRTPRSVGRIIARPYLGQPGSYSRTANRHDYAMLPPSRTVLNAMSDAGYDVWSIGKINDIFSGQGITGSWPSVDNAHGMALTIERMQQPFKGLIFTNLVDFDAKYGHRRDPQGYAEALRQFDAWLPTLQQAMGPHDLVVITADHGNDPYHSGTDHTREHVPLLVWHQGMTTGIDLGVRSSFADVAATIAEAFYVPAPAVGHSFWSLLMGVKGGSDG